MPRIAAGPGEHKRESVTLRASPTLRRVPWLSERLDKPESTIYQMVKEGRIPGVVRIGRTIRFKAEEIEAWIERGGESSTTA